MPAFAGIATLALRATDRSEDPAPVLSLSKELREIFRADGGMAPGRGRRPSPVRRFRRTDSASKDVRPHRRGRAQAGPRPQSLRSPRLCPARMATARGPPLSGKGGEPKSMPTPVKSGPLAVSCYSKALSQTNSSFLQSPGPHTSPAPKGKEATTRTYIEQGLARQANAASFRLEGERIRFGEGRWLPARAPR